MFPDLSPRLLCLKESATLAINLKALQMRRQGQEVFHFGFGQSPFPVPEPLQQALRRNVDKKEYLPPSGLPELCQAVAAFYRQEFGYEFAGENVCIGPGSKELISQTIYLIEGPLLVPSPSWVCYGPHPAWYGKEIVPVDTQRDNGYRLQADALDRALHRLGPCQKLLVLNNPNNPTGALYSKNELEELAKVCRANQVIVFSDEIYAMLNFTNRPHCSMAHYYPEGTIVTGGLSKSFAAGGYRLGVMLLPRELKRVLQALKSVISETFSAVCAPIQYAALEVYGNFESVRPFIMRTNEIQRWASEYLHRRFISMGLNCPEPEGAFYLFPDFQNWRHALGKRGVLTSRQLCDLLLEHAHVAVLPGADFYLSDHELGVRFACVDYDGSAALEAWPGFERVSDVVAARIFPHLIGVCDRLERFLSSFAGASPEYGERDLSKGYRPWGATKRQPRI